MERCEDFELAVELRRRGLLEPERARQLEAHLRGCAGCQAYASISERVGRAMSTHAANASQNVDWAQLRERIMGSQRRDWPAVGLGVLAAGFGPVWAHVARTGRSVGRPSARLRR